MKCPYCGGKTKTMQSRQRNEVYQRRHECKDCHRRYSTYELSIEEYKQLKKYKKRWECLEREGLHCDKGKILFECKPIFLRGCKDGETKSHLR